MSVSRIATRLVVASRNRKVGEIRDLLAPHGIEVVGVEFPTLPDSSRTGPRSPKTRRKKRPRRPAALLWTLGEDSGLEVAALAGPPEFTRPATADRVRPTNPTTPN